MSQPLDQASLDLLFTNARTYNGFTDEPIDDAKIRALYDLLKWGPTAFNAQPARYLFIKSAEAKNKLIPTLSRSNQAKSMAAPLNIVVAYDMKFFEHLPRFSANPGAAALYEKNPELVEPGALKSGSLQGGYLILAVRALGLDIGPMAGFNPVALNEAFFPDGRYKVNFVANVGYGDPASLQPRAERFGFDEVAQIL
jgi:3-hydroxypropanoate dehydrogenase